MTYYLLAIAVSGVVAIVIGTFAAAFIGSVKEAIGVCVFSWIFLVFILTQNGNDREVSKSNTSCKVVKTPVDIDTYEYTLFENEQPVEKGTELKKYLDRCSQIKRKNEWMKTHKEEVLMEEK